MNIDVASLLTRPYLQVVDDLLTAMAGGVVNEPAIYDIGSDLYPLSRQARDVRSVTGTVGRAPYSFLQNVDVAFDEGRNSVAWLPGGTGPDDGTTFFVDYFVTDSSSPLTDLNVGSVTRTLAESFARETATVYAEIGQTYRAGFVDTATGVSLDLVVAILGVTRRTKELAQGVVSFFRDPAVQGNIAIPAGTLLRTTRGTAEFETSESRTLQAGQARIDAPVRAGVAFPGPAGQVASGEISILAQSLAGIARISNFDPTALGDADETDEQLRVRAKTALRAAGKATLAALIQAVVDQGAAFVEARDPDGAPGRVALQVEVAPVRLPGVLAAVQDTRAAGVVAHVQGRYVYVTPRLVAGVDPRLTQAGRDRASAEIVAAVQANVDSLGSGQPLIGQALLAAVKAVPDISDVRVVEMIAATDDLIGGTGDPVELLLDAVASAPPGGEALREALTRALDARSAPAGELTPAPELILGPTGAPVTDADLDAGTFTVQATMGGEPWWITLAMTTDDVRLLAAGG